MTVSWALSDQERAAPIPARPGHVCRFGLWFRADVIPGHPTNRYRHDCKICGQVQYGRGDDWGRNIRIEKG